MPEVVNPAVIIGLGGTGKWVLTYVKKNLLDTYGGEMPKTVRLLSFDTTSEKISRDGVPQEEDARVGNVQLDKQAEFVYLGGNIQQICREVRAHIVLALACSERRPDPAHQSHQAHGPFDERHIARFTQSREHFGIGRCFAAAAR